MRLEYIKEFGSEFFDNGKQSENILFLSFIDILEQCEEEDNEEKK